MIRHRGPGFTGGAGTVEIAAMQMLRTGKRAATAAAFLGALAGTTAAQVIETGSTETLTYIGFTTSPLAHRPDKTLNVTGADLPSDFTKMLGVAPDDYVLFIRPLHQGYFWFDGKVTADNPKPPFIYVQDENGWYSATNSSSGTHQKSGRSVATIPTNSNRFDVYAYSSETPGKLDFSTSFTAWRRSPENSNAAPAPATPMPITVTDDSFTLEVHRVMSGISSLSGWRGDNTLREQDYLKGSPPAARLPVSVYTGIVYELTDSNASSRSFLGSLLDWKGRAVNPLYTAWGTVTDADGTTWSTDFAGSRGGWGEIGYMDTPVNLPANQGPFTFDLYFTRNNRNSADISREAPPAPPDLSLDLQIPARGEVVDLVTTTIQNRRLTVRAAGANTDLPRQISEGQFSGPSITVSSPDPIPGLSLQVEDAAGHIETNEFRHNTPDLIHDHILIFGGNQTPTDPFQPGTSATVQIRLPDTLHFQFKAIPERPS